MAPDLKDNEAKRELDSGVESLDGSVPEDYKKLPKRDGYSTTFVHDPITIALPENPKIFPEGGHLIYMPCLLCGFKYHRNTILDQASCCGNSPNEKDIQTYKCGNHLYVSHWVFFRCSKCPHHQISKNNTYKSNYVCTSNYSSRNLSDTDFNPNLNYNNNSTSNTGLNTINVNYSYTSNTGLAPNIHYTPNDTNTGLSPNNIHYTPIYTSNSSLPPNMHYTPSYTSNTSLPPNNINYTPNDTSNTGLPPNIHYTPSYTSNSSLPPNIHYTPSYTSNSSLPPNIHYTPSYTSNTSLPPNNINYTPSYTSNTGLPPNIHYTPSYTSNSSLPPNIHYTPSYTSNTSLTPNNIHYVPNSSNSSCTSYTIDNCNASNNEGYSSNNTANATTTATTYTHQNSCCTNDYTSNANYYTHNNHFNYYYNPNVDSNTGYYTNVNNINNYNNTNNISNDVCICNHPNCIRNKKPNDYSPDTDPKLKSTNDDSPATNAICPLSTLKQMSMFYAKHNMTCPGGLNCSLLLIDPDRVKCFNDNVVGPIIQSTVPEPPQVLNQDIGSLLTTLPQVDIPTYVKSYHNCRLNGCVMLHSLNNILFPLSCFLTGSLCEGTYSVILKVHNQNNGTNLCLKAACLLHYKMETYCHSVDTEILLSRRMLQEGRTCENILPLLGSFRLDDIVFLVSYFQENGTLEDYLANIGRQSEFSYVTMVENICNGLKFLHSYNIAHRNLTIDNILVDITGTLKIAGFGSSCVVQPDTYTTYPYLSYPYAAPELFQTREFDPLKPDIWAVGLIVYYIFRREHMYPDSCVSFKYNDPFMSWTFSDLSRHFIQYLLIRDFGQRPDAKQVLTHAWFSLYQ
ncbi:hypothetical protein Ahia01_001200900 [Argonauta hians]